MPRRLLAAAVQASVEAVSVNRLVGMQLTTVAVVTVAVTTSVEVDVKVIGGLNVGKAGKAGNEGSKLPSSRFTGPLLRI